MANAYGFVEISGTVAAITALDTMTKASDVQLVTWERKWGGRLVTLIVKGTVDNVKEAIHTAKTYPGNTVVAEGVLPNPHPEIVRLINKSKSIQAGG